MLCPVAEETGGDPQDMLDLSCELEKYYTVVSKIRTLTYGKLANLPIKFR